MVEVLLPIGFAVFLWWFSTGAIFFLNARERSTHRLSMALMTVVAIAALYGLFVSTGRADIVGAYLGFSCGLLIWGWQAASHFLGFITGPNKDHCPADASTWVRFRKGFATGLYHEVVIILTALLLLALSWGQPNWFGFWTFVVLWGMHTSAKLNIFLGVRNVYPEFLPPHLDHLKTYFRNARMNPLLPLSVIVGSLVSAELVLAALDSGRTAFEVTGFTLLATLMVLAVIEHILLILPISVSMLWNWSLRNKKDGVGITG